MIKDNSNLVKRLAANTQRFTEKMTEAGFAVGGHPEHPICPIMLGDARLASEFADEILDLGVFVIGFSYPVVPKGKVCINHTLLYIL